MPGIPPALNQRLRDTLARCGPFDSDAVLCALFTDARISPWRDRIPDNTPNRAARVDALITALHNQTNEEGDNAFLLFLDVLIERHDPADACHRDLAQLAKELMTVFQPLPIVTQAKNSSTQQRILIAVAIIAVLSIAAILILSILKPKPFDDAHFGILVADFVCGAAEKKPCPEGADLAEIAYEDLLRRIQRDNLTDKIELRRINALTSENEARKVGASYNAKLIVWGYVPHDQSSAQKTFVPSFILLQDIQMLTSVDPILFGVRISGSDTFALSQQLAARTTSVSNFILAVFYLSVENPDSYTQAKKLIMQSIDSTEEELQRIDSQDSRYDDLRFTLSIFYTIRGYANAALGNEPAAFEDYHTALDYNQDTVQPHIGLGNYYYARRDLDAARREFEIALSLDPHSFSVHYGLAIVAFAQQNYQEAAQLLEDALEIASERSSNTDAAHLVLGLTYQQLGQNEAAAQQFQTLLSKENAYAHLRQAAATYLASLPGTPPVPRTLFILLPTSMPLTTVTPTFTLTPTPTPTLFPTVRPAMTMTPRNTPSPTSRPSTVTTTPTPTLLPTSQPSPAPTSTLLPTVTSAP